MYTNANKNYQPILKTVTCENNKSKIKIFLKI